MSSEEIKSECEFQYAQIKNAEERLKELRAICKHENTFGGNWSWRIGSIEPATICSDCGSLIKLNHSNTIIREPKERLIP